MGWEVGEDDEPRHASKRFAIEQQTYSNSGSGGGGVSSHMPIHRAS